MKAPASRRALLVAIVTTGVVAGLVSWATPDGNLVVTGVPALVAGLVAYGAARWWGLRRARD